MNVTLQEHFALGNVGNREIHRVSSYIIDALQVLPTELGTYL